MKTPSWSNGRGAVVAFVLLGAVGVVSAAHERSRDRAAESARAQALAGVTAAVIGPETGARHVVLNGARARVFVTSVAAPVERAAADAEQACGNDASPFDDPASTLAGAERGGAPRFERERTHTDVASDGSAISVLCVVRSTSTGERHESMTFLRRVSDDTTSASTITRESPMDLATMFPLEGDAPGHDPVGFPRPERTRRVVAATIVESRHDVWIYETRDTASDAMEAYDRRMSAAGFEIVRASAAPARSYRRGDEELIAVFEASAPARITMSRAPDRTVAAPAPSPRSSPRDGS
ncbi:MAG: hypothetical protein JST00_20615 [Deltaproteobacteria bacterium]|nr:hypothetical protein [Deltaproteobacteria bacterium]